jgi:hypothetical protein
MVIFRPLALTASSLFLRLRHSDGNTPFADANTEFGMLYAMMEKSSSRQR